MQKRQLIKARFNEGATYDDFELVIKYKAKKWLEDAKMVSYLRPQTLFGTKFEGYLQEAKRKATKTKPKITKEQILEKTKKIYEERGKNDCAWWLMTQQHMTKQQAETFINQNIRR